jgi:hypothetical protein
LRNYLPDRTPIYAAPFGSLSVLRKECIQIGCAPKGIPQRLIAYRVGRSFQECVLIALAIVLVAGFLLVRPDSPSQSEPANSSSE